MYFKTNPEQRGKSRSGNELYQSIIRKEDNIALGAFFEAVVHMTQKNEFHSYNEEGKTKFIFRNSKDLARYNRYVESMKGLTNTHILAEKRVRESKNKGVFSNDLKYKLKLHHNQKYFKKIMGDLVKSGLVRAVRPLGEPSKICYVSSEVKVTKDLCGGPWYKEGNLDVEFIAMMEKVILKLGARKTVTAAKLATTFGEKKMFSVPVGPSDTLQVLHKMYFDGKFETKGVPVSEFEVTTKFYIKDDDFLNESLSNMPCGRCSMVDTCSPGGAISPENCKYMDEWLRF
eukprot:g1342.t1